ncbi:D-alanyl-D-alanine carboxypeptidase family protein [Listeria cornellensis]|uniref:D-alanyl-D-alanine carboxypeptidase n=1 Tax=Listeria cornellensis FSL F6-0969 TaxID=1265820 RepID=W7BV77_9LIST|nr:D-alanyl-D-alanine carboxypeptidase family protein [Listeria cornellensis]EUJ29657.1 D-alanyl-D-alanine carboxypeptidase [Listeria cornellensis FSL F6-0969]
MKITKICVIALFTLTASVSMSACADKEAVTPTKEKPTVSAPEKIVKENPVPEPSPKLGISAASSALYDIKKSKPLYEENPQVVTPIASVTKLMTAYLVLQAIHNKTLSWDEKLPLESLDDKAAISLYMTTNKKEWTVKDLYAAMIVMSANDAAEALGKRLEGNDFPAKMNKTAKKMGLSNQSNFVSASGLDKDGKENVSTSKDLFLLASGLITKFPEVLDMTSKASYVTSNDYTLKSTDALLANKEIDGLDGLKTGFTDGAGYCFVGTAKQNGKRLITIVLKAKTTDVRFQDTKKLMAYGFTN